MFNYMVPGDRRDGLPLVHITIHNALVVAGKWYPAVAGFLNIYAMWAKHLDAGTSCQVNGSKLVW
jgi:hypothetical protein